MSLLLQFYTPHKKLKATYYFEILMSHWPLLMHCFHSSGECTCIIDLRCMHMMTQQRFSENRNTKHRQKYSVCKCLCTVHNLHCLQSDDFLRKRCCQKFCLLVSWCFEPSQPLGVTSGLNMTFNQCHSYSARKTLNIDRNISTAQLFQTYTHTYTKSHTPDSLQYRRK